MGKVKLIYGTVPYLYTTTPQLIYGSIPFVTAPVKTLSAIESPPPPPPSGASISSIDSVLKANIASFSGVSSAQIASIDGINWS